MQLGYLSSAAVGYYFIEGYFDMTFRLVDEAIFSPDTTPKHPSPVEADCQCIHSFVKHAESVRTFRDVGHCAKPHIAGVVGQDDVRETKRPPKTDD